MLFTEPPPSGIREEDTTIKNLRVSEWKARTRWVELGQSTPERRCCHSATMTPSMLVLM